MDSRQEAGPEIKKLIQEIIMGKDETLSEEGLAQLDKGMAETESVDRGSFAKYVSADRVEAVKGVLETIDCATLEHDIYDIAKEICIKGYRREK